MMSTLFLTFYTFCYALKVWDTIWEECRPWWYQRGVTKWLSFLEVRQEAEPEIEMEVVWRLWLSWNVTKLIGSKISETDISETSEINTALKSPNQ